MVVTWKGYGEGMDRKSETCDRSAWLIQNYKNFSSEMSTSAFESQALSSSEGMSIRTSLVNLGTVEPAIML